MFYYLVVDTQNAQFICITHTQHSYPWEVSPILSSAWVMLDTIQHQIKREDSHTEDGPTAHSHLLFQFHPVLLAKQCYSKSRREDEFFYLCTTWMVGWKKWKSFNI